MPFPDPPPLPPELRDPPDGGPGARHRRAGRPPNATIQRLAQVSVLGTNLAFTVGAGALVGWLLDRWLGTGPWLLLALALLGLVGGLLRFFKDAAKLVKGPKR